MFRLCEKIKGRKLWQGQKKSLKTEINGSTSETLDIQGFQALLIQRKVGIDMLLFLIVFGIYCWAGDTYYIDGKLVNVKKLKEKQAIERRKAEKEIREGSYYAPLMPEYDIPVEKDTSEWTFYQDMIGDTDDYLFR